MNVLEIIELNEALPDGWSMVRGSDGIWQAMDPDGTVRASGRVRGTVAAQAERYIANSTPGSRSSSTPRSAAPEGPSRPRITDFEVADNGDMRIKFDDGTEVNGNARRADRVADQVQDKLGESDPALKQRLISRRRSRLQRLKDWFKGTKLYRFCRLVSNLGVGALVGAYMTWDQMSELFAQHQENHAALDTLHAIHEVQSASQEIALRKARDFIDSAHYTAIGAEVATLVVGLISVGLMTTRVVRMIPAAIPGAGWIVSALIMAVTEGLGFLASKAIEKYGPGLFARWFASEWSSAPERDPSTVEIEPMTFDIDDEDINQAIRREVENGASRDTVDAVRDELLQGVDMDKIRGLVRPSN